MRGRNLLNESKVIGVIKFVSITLLGVILGIIFLPDQVEHKIGNWAEKTIYSLNTDIRVTITTNFYFDYNGNRPLDITYIKEQASKLEKQGFLLLNIEDRYIKIPSWSTFRHQYLEENKTNYCIINALAEISPDNEFAPLECSNTDIFFDFSKPECLNCIKHSISIRNWGKTPIKELRVRVCADREIFSVSDGFIKDIYPNCFKLDKSNLLPTELDAVRGIFIEKFTEPPYLGAYGTAFDGLEVTPNEKQIEAIVNLTVNITDLDGREFKGKNIWKFANIIISNCVIENK